MRDQTPTGCPLSHYSSVPILRKHNSLSRVARGTVLVPKCSPGRFLHFGTKTILLAALDEELCLQRIGTQQSLKLGIFKEKHFSRPSRPFLGADLIYGHSSHHIKGVEVYKGKLIVYGCGDFLSDYEGIDGVASQFEEDFRDDVSFMYFPGKNIKN